MQSHFVSQLNFFSVVGGVVAGILQYSGLYVKLEKLVGPHQFVICGDPAYPLKPLLMKPYGSSSLTTTQLAFNSSMSRVHQAVQSGFGKVVTEFAFLDFKKNQKLLRQVAHMCTAATILTVTRVCMAARCLNTLNFIHPSLHEYLRLHH